MSEIKQIKEPLLLERRVALSTDIKGTMRMKIDRLSV